jgi:hypothetical protein
VALCLVALSSGQDASAIARDHEWGGAAVWDPTWNGPSKGSEILADDLSIRIRNNKPRFMALFFERRQVVRFESREDILAHAHFTLPESLDPGYDRRYTPWEERDEEPCPLWFNVRLDEFAARIIRPDGTWGEVGVFSTIAKEQVRTIRGMETAWAYVLDLQSIAPGDVVEVHWKYMIPYDNNWESTQGWRAFQWMDNWSRLPSWRVFFHGTLPIRDQRVSITYDLKHGLVLDGPPPTQRLVNGDAVTAIWRHKDLPGCIDEVNARPGEDLPHLTVLLAPEDYRYWRRDRLSGMPIQQPHWLQTIRQREAKAEFWRRVALKRIPDKQNRLLNEFMDEHAGHLPDSAGAERMAVLHDRIAERFTYEDDHLWYLDIDRGLARMGEQVDEERLRDISRYDLYAKLANALELPYTTAYVLDKRIGRMNDRWTTPMWDNEFLIGVRNGDHVQWMHPKRTAFGWLTDELPFYWEGSSALLMDLEHLLQDDPAPALFTDLPVTDASANVRVTEYAFEIDPSDTSLSGTVRTFLSGQFSTLARAAYMDAVIDSTVDPLYGKRSIDVVGLVVLGEVSTDLGTSPPYRFRADARVRVDDAVQFEADGSLSVDLSRFVSHVVPSTFAAAERDLPFHWDFAQDDRFIITIKGVEGIEVVPSEFLIDESSPTARLHRSMESDQGGVRFESHLFVFATKEKVADAAALGNVLDAAKAEGLFFQLKLEDPAP